MATSIGWTRSWSFITVTGHPAISVPTGVTGHGLPVDLQFPVVITTTLACFNLPPRLSRQRYFIISGRWLLARLSADRC